MTIAFAQLLQQLDGIEGLCVDRAFRGARRNLGELGEVLEASFDRAPTGALWSLYRLLGAALEAKQYDVAMSAASDLRSALLALRRRHSEG